MNTNKFKPIFTAEQGISKRLIEDISWHKQEPEWMRKLRLKSFEIFEKKAMPNWGPDLSKLDFNKLAMYIKPGAKKAKDWKNVPKEIKQVYDKLGIPKAEKKYLAGQVSQFESEAVYHKLKDQYEARGIIFCDMDTAVVEIFVKKNAKVRYTTVQNWSKDVYNLNTKRAIVGENASIEWVGGSMGSSITMLYPASYLVGRGARADHLNIAFAGPGQIKDTGAKIYHGAPDTSSTVVSKSICRGGGQGIYRGLVKIAKGAKGAKTHVRCDSLILDDQSIAKTYPHLEIYEQDVSAGHEATAGRVSDDQIFYLRTRGLSEQEALAMIISGFVEPIVKELPMEYAIELNRLIQLEMEGSVG